ncbi:MAG: galactose mutarotase [Bacteroidales bacterium]|jgi:aldose 1-epimerase|nr:galactose mutarotase [Bacteroidales bacterium]
MLQITRKAVARRSGKDIMLFRLTDKSGAFVELLNYGATLVSAFVPDRKGRFANVILNYPNIEDYLSDTCYLGSTIGRFANRIGNAQFTLDGKTFHLDRNDGENCNHSGYSGFHQKIFDAEVQGDELALTAYSPDGEGGFPGNMKVTVCFSFRNHLLTIRYRASADCETLFNPACHAYFNLSGQKGSAFQHELHVNASEYLEADNHFLPTGKILPVSGTAFDFTQYRIIEQMAALKHDALTGYNAYYPVPGNDTVRRLASLKEAGSGRTMTVCSSMPGVLFYSGDYLCGEHQPFEGLCLEAQFFPDTPNHAHFPSCNILPGKQIEHVTCFQFEIL